MRFEIIIAAAVALTLPSCQSGKDAAKPPVRLGPEVRQLANEVLAPLVDPVTIQLTLGGAGESRAEEVVALAELMGEITAKVTVKELDLANHPDTPGPGVSHGPIIEMMGKAPGTLRYYGYPERREMRPFLEGVLSASGHLSALPPAVVSYMKELDEEVWIRIFTTPD
jgi:hypothetical protein